jgi:ferrous iron transport protein A
MTAHFKPESVSLDQLGVGEKASISSIEWDALEESEASRLRHFGFDEGVVVEPLHLGPFGRDPLAIRVGRMTVAIRRAHARAVRVVPNAK